jgi:hypothetical protein
MAFEYSRAESFTDSLKHVIDDVRELFREEMALARAELRHEMSSFSTAAIQLVGGAVAGGFAAGFLLLALAQAFAATVGWPIWAGYLMMAVVLGAISAGVIWAGRNRIRSTPAVPRQTVETLKETKEWMKHRMASESK